MTAANFNKLLSPLQLGNLTLKNRIILASLTRSRGLVPNDVMKEYYIQRSNAGLILTEATLVSFEKRNRFLFDGVKTMG